MIKKSRKTYISIEKRVMERISAEKVTLVSYEKILLKKLSWAFLIIVFFVTSAFFVSVFINRITIPKLFGLKFVLSNFPWFSGGLAFGFFLLTFAALEYKKVFYRWSLLSLFVVLMFCLGFSGFLLHKSQLHTYLRGRYSSIYSVDGGPFEIVAGNVLEVRTSSSFVFRSVWGVRMTVYTQTGESLGGRNLSLDDSVLLIGNRENNAFYARGVLLLSRVRN